MLVHGIGWDSSEIPSGVNLSVPEEQHSFVYAAHQAGYSTFRFDRLGCGPSEVPADGYNVVQPKTEVAILTYLLQTARNETLVGERMWDRVVGIGSSYGSAQLQAITQGQPDLLDGVSLTGFSSNTSGLPFYLSSANYQQVNLVLPQPNRFPNISNHWLMTPDAYAYQRNYAWLPNVTPDALQLARVVEVPVTQGVHFELTTLIQPATNWTKPTQVILGDRDFSFAQGGAYLNAVNQTHWGELPAQNDSAGSSPPAPTPPPGCSSSTNTITLPTPSFPAGTQGQPAPSPSVTSTSILSDKAYKTLLDLYPQLAHTNGSENVTSAVIVPDTGHGIVLHTSARAAADAVIGWLNQTGF